MIDNIPHLSPYPDYGTTEMPWLEAVPINWQVVRAKVLFTRMRRLVRPEDDVITAFRDGTVTLRKNRRTTGFTEALQEIGYQGIRKGDLVIHAMDAFAGAIGVSDSDGKGTPVYSVCQASSGVHSWYYALLLREMSRCGFLLSLAKGIRVRSTDFRFADFASLDIPLPPLPEQETIVRFLDHADGRLRRAIRAKQKLIKLLEEQKQAIIHRAVTRGLDPNVRLKPSGVEWLGDIPEHWEVWNIARFAKVGNGSTPSRGNSSYWNNGKYPWLNSSSVNRNTISYTDQFVTETALNECHLPKIAPGSILVAITGQGKTRGTNALLEIEATINQHIAYITPRNNNFISSYYLHTTLSAAYKELRRISDDSGSTKGALTCNDIAHFKVPIPPVHEQKCITSSILKETHIV